MKQDRAFLLIMTVKQLYDFTFEHTLLDAEVDIVKQLYIQLSKNTEVAPQTNNLSLLTDWDTLVEYTYEDVLRLLST